MAAHFLKAAQSGSPAGEFEGSLYFKTWQHTRLALANYLCEVDGTDGCSEEDDGEPRWAETARLDDVTHDPNVLTEEEEEEEKAQEREVKAQNARAESRAAALALPAAVSNRKKRRRTQVVADDDYDDDDDDVDLEVGTLTPHDNTTALSTPELTDSVDTTRLDSTALTSPAIRPKALIAILKTPAPTGTNTSAPLNLNFDSISISPTHPLNNKSIRAVTFRPTATVQDTPAPYAYPHRAETEYRDQAYYHRPSEGFYEPGEWAEEARPISKKTGKKRQREEDGENEDGDDSGDWQYTGAVLTTEEVVKLGKRKQLRGKRS